MKKPFRQQDVSIKAPSRQMWRRSLLTLVIVCFCFGAVGGKLAVIQIGEYAVWQERAMEQQMSDSIISPKRGWIYDTNMEVLAQTTEVATVIMAPSEIPDEATRTLIADELSVLLEINRDTLYKKTGKKTSLYEVVKSKIDHSLCDTFIDWVQEHQFTGIFRVIQDYKREYPLGSVLSCVLGFTGTDNYGLEGLEAKYDSQLAGKAGRVVTAKNGWGDAMPNELRYESTIEAEAGNSLVLTIDTTIQRITEKYLEIAVRETGATNRGAAIVMDVQTGAILAMATKGDYDLNQPRELTDPDTAAQIALLSGDEQSAALLEALQKQWKNKPISEFYEPGSVFKVFTASAGVQEGLVNENTHFFCSGTYTMPGVKPMKCHVYPRSHGDQTFAEAIAHSCNPAFMTLGGMIGGHLFCQYHAAFGFTELTGIDMLGEARVTPTLYHAEETIRPVDVATSAIGQTFKVTPIQMITGLACVANGGRLMKPYVVRQILDENGNVVEEIEPTVRRTVVSEDTARRMAAMMEGVVEIGAKNAYVPGYHVAGKTGTSVKTDQAAADGVRKNVVASFGGFAPSYDPRIAVLVLIDEPQTAIRYGGQLSAPVAQKILSEALPYLGVEPQYTDEEIADMNRVAPDVTGASVSEAENRLASVQLQAKLVGSGGEVLRQVPAAGESMPQHGTVVLYTEETDESTSVPVPNFVGMTLSEANNAAVGAGLNLSIAGLDDRDGQAVVRAQSEEAETAVPPGTVVRVEVLYQDTVE